jgi:hypothetical protein
MDPVHAPARRPTPASWWTREDTPRFALLLATMFAELLLAPLLTESPAGFVIARLLTSLVLLAALVAVGARRVPIGLFLAAFTAHWLAFHLETPWALTVASVLQIAFLGCVIGFIISHVLRDRKVSLDTIAGAACGYMLLGLLWGEVYTLALRSQPGSMEIPASFLQGGLHEVRLPLLYFSFITLTTVGYGEIHPNGPGMGGLAVSEAVLGQLYLAIAISRLVGLHIANRPRDDAG